MTYAEKLKDPRWQKKRLEILNRDNFTCRAGSCFETEKTLHVHHLDYIHGNDPWDYPDYYFLTVCEDCHNDITENRRDNEQLLIRSFRLQLHDTFIQRCATQIFASDNLHEIIYLLWDLKGRIGEEKLIELLADESVLVAKSEK